MSTKPRILVVDDEPEMADLVAAMLSKEGYQVRGACSGEEGLRQVYAFRPDLALLDVMMPDMTGWQMLERLRTFSDVPVIMLTALTGTDNTVRGLEGGADDYITKPFKADELKARVRAALRRAAQPAAEEGPPLRFDGSGLVIDPTARQVTVGGEAVHLTPTEYRLLLALAHNAGQVLSYDELLRRVWGPGYEDSPANVKVYIRHLRRKIEPDPRQPRLIRTQWGVGYYLAPT